MASRRNRSHDRGERARGGPQPGAEELRHEHVIGIQRTRILRALLEESAQRGSAGLTVAPIVTRAGVSRRTFYELFSDVEACFLAALDDALERVCARVAPAWRQEGTWRERIRAALIELLAFLDNDPVTGRLMIVDTLAAGPKALERRRHVLAQVIAAVEEGRNESKGGGEPPLLTGEGIVGAVSSVIYGRMLEDRPEPLLALTGSLMSMIVLPYLGPAAARRELERPLPERIPETPAHSLDGSGLGDLPIRVTYRTLRVLSAVDSLPGASNRQIGKASGVEDQGQISKLLSRLEKVGLIHNGNSRAPLRGAPNAWALTEHGERVVRSLRVEPQRAGSA